MLAKFVKNYALLLLLVVFNLLLPLGLLLPRDVDQRADLRLLRHVAAHGDRRRPDRVGDPLRAVEVEVRDDHAGCKRLL